MHAYYHYYWLFFRPKDGLVAKISKFGFSSFASISHEQLGLFLCCCEFLRFRTITLKYSDWLSYDDSGSQSIDKKCHLFVKHLKSLKAAFNDSTKIEFNARIGYGQSQFTDSLQLLNHLRNELLPVCDSARRYEFTLCFRLQEASATHILKSILQMPPINSSTNVKFNFDYTSSGPPILTRLSVDAISAWLDRPNSNNMVIKCKQHQKKPLELRVYLAGVENVHELFEHLKKVHFANSLLKLFLNFIKIVKE